MPRYRIRDWQKHFERDRTKQWKHIQWVPIPNKQGTGYRKIMKQKNGLEIFGCWIALIEVASQCDPRGDLSKYSIDEISDLTMIEGKKIEACISFLSQSLDWIEVIENLDANVNDLDVNVKNLDSHGKPSCDSSSILSSSILYDSLKEGGCKGETNSVDHEGTWERLWQLYPKKHGFRSAMVEWAKVENKTAVFEQIKTSLEWQVKSKTWKEKSGQFIPKLENYIKDARWMDQKDIAGTEKGLWDD